MYVDLVNIVQVLFTVYWYVLFASAIISWVPELRDTKVGYWLERIGDPYLLWFRRWIRPVPIGSIQLDVGFLVGIIVFRLVQVQIINLLYNLLRGLSS